MASPPNGGKDPEGSQPKTENPFIRFRQFADNQVSSLLQGIIGLPSAFSKSPPDARWADFDDKLQQRDEANKLSKQSNKSESAREEYGGVAEDDEVQVPVRKYRGREQYSPLRDEGRSDQTAAGTASNHPPLYSAVSASLFAHLNGTADVTHDESSFPTRGITSPDKVSLDGITALQHMTFNHLKTGSSLQSDYSLLPYLLFSPYSPLKLSSGQTSNTHQRDNFPFCDAFEDLIRVSQGRPMATVWTRIGLQSPWLFHHPTPYAASCMEWIRGMQSFGLLQESIKPDELQAQNQRELLDKAPSNPSLSPPQRENANDGSKSPAEAVSKETTDAKTELDMYERFLQMASSPASLGSMVESLLADIEREFKAIDLPAAIFPAAEKRFQDLRSSNTGLSISSLLSELEKDIRGLSPQETRRAIAHILTDTDEVLASALTPEGRRDLKTAWSDKQGSQSTLKSAKAGREPSSDPDKIISTSTTTEHIKNEDGSVETSVTVWKRFADGRETITSSTHTEDPWSEELPPGNENQETKEEGKKSEKSGWFWK